MGQYEIRELKKNVMHKNDVTYICTYLKIAPNLVYWELIGPNGRIDYGNAETKAKAITAMKRSLMYEV